MKSYLKTYLTTLFVINIIFILIVMLLAKRVQVPFGFFRLEIGAILMAIFLSFTVWIFKWEKGNSVMNVICGYITIVPAMFIFRFLFGIHLFRFTWYLYILLVIIGIIYGIVVFVVSKKYKDEVNELNRLLKEKEAEKDE